ncbi:anti-sigma factor [Plasticicumulans acidivorans]|uniref:Anti-sigma-K factor RskA n=1 Tax=Plasticicumulans acidivorans TaxID=886464 RepID=A0A317MS06_9GAMM|nr:anti-sigma factor [Plasticicumulans acidivorans]PWV59761.1 anti-sigma-K factor RskA [Plasticicumulans acidivorans]
MNYAKPELLDALAAAYVLGTLSPLARRRFEHLCRTLPAAGDAVREWERRLGRLAESVPPLTPSAQMWQVIERRTIGARSPRTETDDEDLSRELGAWLRPLLAFACGLLFAVGVVRMYPESFVEPVPVSALGLPPSYLGILAPADGEPVLLASAARREQRLGLKLLQPLNIPQGQVAVLWALSGDAPPRPLGLVPAQGTGEITLSAPADRQLASVSQLGVSFESELPAPGARPQPFVLSGRCVKFW